MKPYTSVIIDCLLFKMGNKRKPDGEYSDNVNTKKSRARIEKMTDAQKSVHKAKEAVRKATSRAIVLLKKEPRYQEATQAARESMEQQTRSTVDAK